MVGSALRRCVLLMMAACVILGTEVAMAHPEIPGEASGRPVAITGGTIHTVSGEVLDGATLLIRNGRIAAVGPRLTTARPARSIPT